MAFSTVGVGSTANDGTGDALRTAFQTVNETIAGANYGQFQGFKNRIINGALDIWDYGTSQTATGISSVNRWYFATDDGSFVASREGLAAGDVNEGIIYFMRVTKPTVNKYAYVRQYVESVRSLAGSNVVVSFWAKSSTSSVMAGIYLTQRFGSGGSSPVFTTLTTNIALTASWARYVFTANLPSISGKSIGSGDALEILLDCFNLASAAGVIDLTGIQLEPGVKTTPFEVRPLGVEQALCDRYYQKKTVQSENGARHIPLTPMRAAPTVAVGVGSAASVTANGFELTHTTAAACTVTADAEL